MKILLFIAIAILVSCVGPSADELKLEVEIRSLEREVSKLKMYIASYDLQDSLQYMAVQNAIKTSWYCGYRKGMDYSQHSDYQRHQLAKKDSIILVNVISNLFTLKPDY